MYRMFIACIFIALEASQFDTSLSHAPVTIATLYNHCERSLQQADALYHQIEHAKAQHATRQQSQLQTVHHLQQNRNTLMWESVLFNNQYSYIDTLLANQQDTILQRLRALNIERIAQETKLTEQRITVALAEFIYQEQQQQHYIRELYSNLYESLKQTHAAQVQLHALFSTSLASSRNQTDTTANHTSHPSLNNSTYAASHTYYAQDN